MGTRAIVKIHNTNPDSPVLANVFFQYDGYPEGLGKDICDMFEKYKVGNGISGQTDSYANGMNCFAAQFVAKQKSDIGGVYLVADDAWFIDYEYHLYLDIDVEDHCEGLMVNPQKIHMAVYGGSGSKIYQGPLDSFNNYLTGNY